MNKSKSVVISRELLELALTPVRHSASGTSVSLVDQRAIGDARKAIVDYLNDPESSSILTSDLMIQMLGHRLQGVENYVEETFEVEGVGDVTVTMQKTDGITPHQFRVQAERAAEDANTVLKACIQLGNSVANCLEAGRKFQEVIDAAKRVTMPTTWEECQKLSDDPLVHDALTTFGHDNTEDNAVCLIRAILHRANGASE